MCAGRAAELSILGPIEPDRLEPLQRYAGPLLEYPGRGVVQNMTQACLEECQL